MLRIIDTFLCHCVYPLHCCQIYPPPLLTTKRRHTIRFARMFVQIGKHINTFPSSSDITVRRWWVLTRTDQPRDDRHDECVYCTEVKGQHVLSWGVHIYSIDVNNCSFARFPPPPYLLHVINCTFSSANRYTNTKRHPCIVHITHHYMVL